MLGQDSQELPWPSRCNPQNCQGSLPGQGRTPRGPLGVKITLSIIGTTEMKDEKVQVRAGKENPCLHATQKQEQRAP